MSTKKAYQQKIEAEVELAQAKLAELQAEAKSSAADVRIKYDNQIKELEQKIDATKDLSLIHISEPTRPY